MSNSSQMKNSELGAVACVCTFYLNKSGGGVKISNVDELKVIENAAQRKRGDLLNENLYKLAKQFPLHNDIEEVYAKVVIIGKTYSAPLHRGAGHDSNEGDFYWDVAIPQLIKGKIDQLLAKLPKKPVTEKNLPIVLEVHGALVNIIAPVIGLRDGSSPKNHRSFASKYLHFHFPDLFFIYDSLALRALRKYEIGRRITSTEGCDKTYESFCWKCLSLRDAIKEQYQIQLTPRQLDNLLLGK